MVATLILALAFQGSSSSEGIRNTLLIGNDAIYQLDPVPVASGAEALIWSPDGTYLMVKRVAPMSPKSMSALLNGQQPPVELTSEREFVIHSPVSGKTVSALRLPLSVQVEGVRWLTGTAKAVITTNMRADNEQQPSVYLVSNGAAPKQILSGMGFYSLDVIPSKYKPVMAVKASNLIKDSTGVTVESRLFVLDSDGAVIAKLDKDMSFYGVSFAPDGKLLVSNFTRQNGKMALEWSQVNLSSGALTPVPNYKPQDQEGPDPFGAMPEDPVPRVPWR